MIDTSVLRPQLAQVGYIKIGGLETNQDGSAKMRTAGSGRQWQAPVKFDHFVVTTCVRDASGNFARDEAIHAKIGDTPIELDIILLANDRESNFRTELAWYNGTKRVCFGDGKQACRLVDGGQPGEVQTVSCPCEHMIGDKPKCKPHGVLTCLLRCAEIAGGVWKLPTTSWNTIRNICGSLDFLTLCTGGKVAGIPLVLRFMPKAITRQDGKKTTIPTVGIFFRGSPVEMLEAAVANETRRLSAGIRMEQLEYKLRESIDEQEEVFGGDEFNPPADTTPGSGIDAALAKKAKKHAKVETEAATGAGPEPAVPAEPAAVVEPARVVTTPPTTVIVPDPAPVSTPPITNPPADESATAIDKAALVKDIVAIRSKHKVMQGTFMSILGKAIGNPKKMNADEWSPEETSKVHQAMVEKFGGAA